MTAVSSLRNGEKTVQQTKEILINRSIGILTAYRRHCAQPGSSLGNTINVRIASNNYSLTSGQLILPEALKLLPMYICGAIKCDAIDGGPEMTPDDKAFAQIKLIGANLSLSQVILYPRLLRIEVFTDYSSICVNLIEWIVWLDRRKHRSINFETNKMFES